MWIPKWIVIIFLIFFVLPLILALGIPLLIIVGIPLLLLLIGIYIFVNFWWLLALICLIGIILAVILVAGKIIELFEKKG